MTSLRALLPALLALALLPAAAAADTVQEATFQDDPLLVGKTKDPAQVEQVLDKLKEIGVDRIRISVFWKDVAPNPDGLQRPDIDATNPAFYPAENWRNYDHLVREIQERGMGVNLNPTSPAPRWATTESPRADLQKNYGPDPIQFGQFVQALGTRYSGTYAMLPRVDYWSIWNEPNQGAWLSPQWSPDPRNAKRFVEAAPHLYRNLVGTAWAALGTSGHAGDTILIGETAPKGLKKLKGLSRQMDALRFVRQMYCLDDNLQLIKGTSAEARNCPTDGNKQAFVDANPGLFKATGFAHHPYELLLSPSQSSGWDDWVTIANLNDLQRELRRIYARYGQPTQDKLGVPLYLTEFGYQTAPDPISVSFRQQAAWINESEFKAYRNRLVRTISQFLLNDDGPVPGATSLRDKYLTFQSGLRSFEGREKQSMKAYVTPIFVTPTRFRKGSRVRVWGGARPASGQTPVSMQIQFRRKGASKWRTLVTRPAKGPRSYLDVQLRPPGNGAMRLLWSNAGRPTASRAITVRRR